MMRREKEAKWYNTGWYKTNKFKLMGKKEII